MTETPIDSSGRYLTKLQDYLEKCNKDGIPCEECPVAKKCQRFWDTQVVGNPVESRRFPALLSRLVRFQKEKQSAL